MTNAEIIKEASEAVEKGLDAGYAVGLLLNIIDGQHKEIKSLNTKVDICEVIIQTLRDENKNLKAELERIRDEESEEDYK